MFKKKLPMIGSALILIAGAFFLLYKVLSPQPVERIITTVDQGPVRQLVSVSGIINAEDTASLAFPVGGMVESVLVRKGDVVATGTILAKLKTDTLFAERSDALAQLRRAEADLAELLAGTSQETREVSTETIALKTTILKNTEAQEKTKVGNAKRALLQSGLTAYSNESNENAIAPTLSGTYSCSEEGVYVIEVFRSNTESGYSFYLSGLETGTFAVSFDQPVTFGTCGLRVLFSAGSSYSGSKWQIDIPNKKSILYTANKNAYDLALSDASSALAVARQELALAKASSNNTNASARPEAILRSESLIDQARARLLKVDTEIDNRILKAPFTGTVTTADILPGEIVTTSPVITLLSPGRFELTARIPEIDIGKLALGQKAEVVFDTNDTEVLTASIDFLSPNATSIDGVAYYEARLALLKKPSWLRSGLNADIDIIIDSREDSIRLPARFISKLADGTYVVLKESGTTLATTTIEVLFFGNDGYTAVSGLTKGQRIIAP